MSNYLIILWKKLFGSTCTLLPATILSLTFSSFAQDLAPGNKPTSDLTNSKSEKSDESESNSREDGSSDKEEGSGDNEQTADSTTSSPDGSEQNPSGGGNVSTEKTSASVVSTPPPSLSFAVPDVAGKAFDVKRDSGTLEDLDELSRVEDLLPDSTPPSGFSEETFNRDIPLLSNHMLFGAFPASARFEQSELDGNNLALEVTSVLDHLSPSVAMFPLFPYSSVVGRNLSLAEGTYKVDGENAFLLGASSDLSYSGEVSFSGSTSRVVLIGGSTVSVDPGSKIDLDVALSDLVVVSRSDWSVSDAAFAAGSKLYLRSLSDLSLKNIDFSATDLVRLEALMDLSLDSARFSAGLQEIQMRATTIDLINVDFPASSVVEMHAMKGGLDSRYPTFGVANRSYGRVNFLRNISYGGKSNLIQDRSSFDLHGTNIKIFKHP